MKIIIIVTLICCFSATLCWGQWSHEATLDWMQNYGDSNQNGVIDEQDLLNMWTRLEKASEHASTLAPHNFYGQQKRAKVEDVTLLATTESHHSEGGYPSLEVRRSILAHFDSNDDGVLDASELPTYDKGDKRLHWKYHQYNSTLPQQVHLSMIANQTGALAVMWVTLERNGGAHVQLTTEQPSNDDHDEDSGRVQSMMNVTAVQFDYSTHNWLFGNYTAHLQRAILDQLTPDTRYWYRVGNGTESGWSQWFDFRSPVQPGSVARPIRIAQCGDQGPYFPFGFKVTQAMAKYHAKHPLDLAVLSGDISYSGTSGSYNKRGEFEFVWDWWGRVNQQMSAYVPWTNTVGNHDLFLNATAFRHRFYNGGGNTFGNFLFSFDVGPVHLLSMDTETDYSAGSPQHSFIASDLAAAQASANTSWIIVSMHRPVYSSDKAEFGAHNGNPQTSHLSAEIEPLFNQYGVDVVLQGHMHCYDRSLPVALGAKVVSTDAHTYSNPGAPIYATVGTAGIFLDYKFEKTDWTAKQFSQWGFAVIEATKTKLSYEWHNALDHIVQDHFTITKN